MIEIGAGGGSIAHVDRLGRLQVGPRSAGSTPGPAAFGKGGTEPTVTDADVIQGLIDPERFAEGRLEIDHEAAHVALDHGIGQALGLDTIQSARGVSEIVDENMASAGRMHAVESGKDLSTRLMIAFGGNGPLHATRLARRAQVNRILIPRNPAVGSAVGFLFAPVSFEIVRSQYAALDTLDLGRLNAFFDEMLDEAQRVVRAGAPRGRLTQRRVALMRYQGQGHEIEIQLPDRALTEDDITMLRTRFEEEYVHQFNRIVPMMRIEILNWAIDVSSEPPAIDSFPRQKTRQRAKSTGERSILCDVTGDWRLVDIYERHALRPGDYLSGPALIVEAQTTTLVSADFTASVDAGGNIWLIRNKEQGQ